MRRLLVPWSVYSQVAFGPLLGEPTYLEHQLFVFGAVTQCVRHGTLFGTAPLIMNYHIIPPLLILQISLYIPPMIPWPVFGFGEFSP